MRVEVGVEASMSPTSLQFPITGMTCAGCSSRLQATLSALPGISEASVNLATERASVSLHAPASPASVVEAIRGAGFDVPASSVRLPIGVGSDNQIGMSQGRATLHEMVLLHRAGLPALDVLRAATAVNARALRRDDLGVLRAGAQADVLVFASSPVADLAVLQRPLLVIADGAIAVDRR